MTTETTTHQAEIALTPIDAVSFFAKYFGEVSVEGEMTMYTVADRLMPDYRGGTWRFAEGPGGTFVCIPPNAEGGHTVCTLFVDNHAKLPDELAGCYVTSILCGLMLERHQSALSEAEAERIADNQINLLHQLGWDIAERHSLTKEWYKLID